VSVSSILRRSLGQTDLDADVFESARSGYAAREAVTWWLFNVHVPFVMATVFKNYTPTKRSAALIATGLQNIYDASVKAGDFLMQAPLDNVCSPAYDSAYRIKCPQLGRVFWMYRRFKKQTRDFSDYELDTLFSTLIAPKDEGLHILGKSLMSPAAIKQYEDAFYENAKSLVVFTEAVSKTAALYDKHLGHSHNAPVLDSFCAEFDIRGLSPLATLPSVEWRRALFIWRFLVKELFVAGLPFSVRSQLDGIENLDPFVARLTINKHQSTFTKEQLTVWERLAPVADPLLFVPGRSVLPLDTKYLVFDLPFAPLFTPKQAREYGHWLAETLRFAAAARSLSAVVVAELALDAAVGASLVFDGDLT
jgi:hypothetical protein